jgi:hypothetical protein
MDTPVGPCPSAHCRPLAPRRYNEGVMTRRRHHGMSSLPAPPCRLRWNLAFPRVALLHVPSRSRPNLFGGD